MGSKKNVDMSSSTDTVKIAESAEPATDPMTETSETGEETPAAPSPAARRERTRSKKYTSARSQVDRTREYDPFAAIELIKRLSYSKFDGTITAHGVMREIGEQATLTFPHATGKSVRAVIVSDEVLADIEAGKIEFDYLIASPAFMPKLTKFARVLGPRGLMPNPKQGTLTEKPEAKQKELESGKVTIFSEKKSPLVHVVIGKTNQETKELVGNLQALIKALGTKMTKLTLAASMSPGVKVALEK